MMLTRPVLSRSKMSARDVRAMTIHSRPQRHQPLDQLHRRRRAHVPSFPPMTLGKQPKGSDCIGAKSQRQKRNGGRTVPPGKAIAHQRQIALVLLTDLVGSLAERAAQSSLVRVETTLRRRHGHGRGRSSGRGIIAAMPVVMVGSQPAAAPSTAIAHPVHYLDAAAEGGDERKNNTGDLESKRHGS